MVTFTIRKQSKGRPSWSLSHEDASYISRPLDLLDKVLLRESLSSVRTVRQPLHTNERAIVHDANGTYRAQAAMGALLRYRDLSGFGCELSSIDQRQHYLSLVCPCELRYIPLITG